LCRKKAAYMQDNLRLSSGKEGDAMRKLICLSLIVFFISCAFTQSPNAVEDESDKTFGCVYADGFAFWVTIPKDWNLDKQTSIQIGVPALFMPDGWSFSNAPAVMYANCYKKTSDKASNLPDFIKSDYEKFKARNPSIQISDLGFIETKDNKKAIVKSFIDPAGGQQAYEAVAYIDDEAIIAIIVLSTSHQKTFDEFLPLFQTMVSSYEFYGKVDGGLSLQELEQLNQLCISERGGRKYELEATKAFFGDLSFLRECAPPDAPVADSFTIYFQVLTNGRMGEIYFFPETPVATCVRRHVIDKTFPRPTRPFVVKIPLSFTR